MRQGCVILGGLALWMTVCMAAGGAAAGQAPSRAEAAKLKNPVSSTPASIATGQQLYTKYCRFCHGTSGKGDSPSAPKDMKPSNLTDSTWDRGSTDGEIYTVIQEGTPPDLKMKGLKGKITDQEAWHLVNYVRSLGGAGK